MGDININREALHLLGKINDKPLLNKDPVGIEAEYAYKGASRVELKGGAKLRGGLENIERRASLSESIEVVNDLEYVKNVLLIFSQKAENISEKYRDESKRLKEIANEFYDELLYRQLDVKFEIDRDVDSIVTKLVRKGDEEVVWQLPKEEAIQVQKLLKYIPGLLIDKNA